MKIKKISTRLSLQISLLLLSFSLVLWFSNSLLLKPLYNYSVKKEMVEGIESLSSIDFLSDATEWVDELSVSDPSHAYDITVEYGNEILYSSSMTVGVKVPDVNYVPITQEPFDGEKDIRFKKPFFPVDQVKSWTTLKDNIDFGTMYNDHDRMNLFVARTTLDNGVRIYLTQGIEPILNSVKQANLLLFSVTGGFMIVALIVAFMISKKFTKPVRQINAHVNQLANLSFDGVLEVNTGDELEDLSDDIKSLAFKLKNALVTLEAQNLQLQRDIESQKKFISNASHELRTPLTLIKGYADELMQGYIKNPEDLMTYIGYIGEESNKMKRLLNEILELSRIESGRMPIRLQNYNLKETIESIMEKYSGYFEEHELDINTELVEGQAEFDLLRFEQIFANYISNAVKYGDASKKIQIHSIEKEDRYTIEVMNTGQPISEEVMQFIWDGFYKADEARTFNDYSFGLGLSIIKGIQQIMNQGFGCENREGWVVFWFDVKKMNDN
ncbi:MAG: HAMP domain-containing histidine kinase [Clostridia bacterium]|nr:HAMP domain-containing histidine kinase [Clostridia bacterium]